MAWARLWLGNGMFTHGKWIGLAVVVAAVAAACASADAAGRQWPMRKQGDILIVDTPHFQIRTDHDPKIANGVATHQELLYQELVRRLGGAKPQGAVKRMSVTLCSTEEKSTQVSRLNLPGGGALHEAGLTGWGFAEDVDRMLRTFRREGTRQVMQQYLNTQTPVWLYVGLSMYFEIGKFDKGRLVVGQTPMLLVQSLHTAAAEGGLLPVSRMVSMSFADWNNADKAKSPQSKVQFQQVWALVHYLEKGEQGRLQRPFVQYITQLGRGKTSQDAWAQVFGANTTAFEARWRAHIKSLQPTEQMDCRTNMRAVTAMAYQARNRSDIVGSIEALRDAAMRGTFSRLTVTQYGAELKLEGAETINQLFRCPHDKRKGDVVSYTIDRPKPDDPPIIRCFHHDGIVMETQWQKDPEKENGLVLGIVSRPAKPGEKEAAEAKNKPADTKEGRPADAGAPATVPGTGAGRP